MALKRGTIIPTIDVVLVAIRTLGTEPKEIAIETSSKLGVNPQIDEEKEVKLIIKGQIYAQKPKTETVTGHELKLTDNVFTPEVAQILQGGTIAFDEEETTKIISYTPPAANATVKGEIFEVDAYSAIYDASGLITGYEKITYPACTGSPVGLDAEDGKFRVPEYTILSTPDNDVAPYVITYIEELPAIS